MLLLLLRPAAGVRVCFVGLNASVQELSEAEAAKLNLIKPHLA